MGLFSSIAGGFLGGMLGGGGGGGSPSSVGSASKLTKEQEEIAKLIGEYLEPRVGAAATPYAGALSTPIPELFTSAYSRLASTLGDYGGAMQQALMKDVSGTPAYEVDLGGVAKQWKETFAVPVMETWRQTVEPMIREQFVGIPGGMYSKARGRGVSRAGSEFFGTYVQPMYWQGLQAELGRGFQSAEAAAARRAPAVAQLAGLPGAMAAPYMSAAQMMMSLQETRRAAEQAEAMRLMPEASPWLQYALQYMGIPTREVVGMQGTPSQMGDLALAGAMLLPSMFPKTPTPTG